MTKRLSILSAILFLLVAATVLAAPETRGLSVVAKDASTGRSAEVPLYNKTYAVIIGIDKYLNLPPDRQLQNAVKDAKGVEDVLKKHYRFDRIVTLYDEQATKDRILELLTEELPRQMGKEDALFVFWAGHGNQEKSDYGDLGYLIPFDGSVDKIRKNLTMAEIRDTISKTIPAKHVFYVMDACYSGLLASRSVDGKTRRDLSYLKEITKESVRQVLTAGGKGEEALDGGPKGHSVFTGRFIERLESANDFITANELQASIKERVYSDARARNHTQTPGYGVLYGMGDFVFIPKQDKLDNLSVDSVARQKELEQLKRIEADAAAAKQKEQAEIARKEAELAELDKQIAQMKGRLGAGAAKTGDSLDAIIAMAEQKDEQGKRLEDLRQQREAEERKRQEEIARLKREADVKKMEQVKTDLAKYRKVAQSKYAQDMKGAAWAALVAAYPETSGVAQGDEGSFLGAFGLVSYAGDVVTREEKARREEERQRETEERQRIEEEQSWKRQGLINDSGAGLQWVRAPDKAIGHDEAEKYAQNLSLAGGGWRLPTRAELKSLYDRLKSVGGATEFGVSGKWVWSSELKDSSRAWCFNFFNGYESLDTLHDNSMYFPRVLAVRSRR